MAGPRRRDFVEEFVEAGELILRWRFGWRDGGGMLDTSIISAANPGLFS